MQPRKAEALIVVTPCGTGALVSLHTTDQVVELVLGGGAGFGDPDERDHAAVSRDLARGYVTPEHVQRHYQNTAVPTGKRAEPEPSTVWA